MYFLSGNRVRDPTMFTALVILIAVAYLVKIHPLQANQINPSIDISDTGLLWDPDDLRRRHKTPELLENLSESDLTQQISTDFFI